MFFGMFWGLDIFYLRSLTWSNPGLSTEKAETYKAMNVPIPGDTLVGHSRVSVLGSLLPAKKRRVLIIL